MAAARGDETSSLPPLPDTSAPTPGGDQMSIQTIASAHAVHRVARDHCLAPSRAVDAPIGGARYGRMFPHLTALTENLPALEKAGQAGGACDAAALLAVAGAVSDDATEAAVACSLMAHGLHQVRALL